MHFSEYLSIESQEEEWPGYDYEMVNRPSRKPGSRVHRNVSQTRPFIGWDGEGYSTDDGDHHYMLFGNSLGESIQGPSLTWQECFPLLLEERNGINVVYSGHYDVVMMTKSMPFVVRDRLYSGKAVRYGGYRMQYFRGKWLNLRYLGSRKEYRTRLYDVFSFFQCSFVKATLQYLGEDETLREIERMKSRRNTFTYDDPSVKPYWQAELVYLVDLMERLRELLAEVDIKPRTWHGPGAVAGAILSNQKMRRYYGPIRADIVDLAERAYYGGRFEQFKVGKIDNVHEYDIRSAYPGAICHLPDYGSATWAHVDEITDWEDINRYGLYKVSWKQRWDWSRIGPFPWRNDQGEIYFPMRGVESWYWGIEVREAWRTGFEGEITIHEGWIPTFGNDVKPFASFVPAMYKDRARMKEEGNPAQMALKLGLNSLYGKLAQSKGATKDKDGNWKRPSWHNVLWAGWITAYVRARLLNAVAGKHCNVVAYETDAVFTTEPLPHLRLSNNLGDWEHKEIDQMLYLHSGVYYAYKDGKWSLKSRGTEADKTKSVEYWKEMFSRLPYEPVDVQLTMHRFGTIIRQPQHFSRWYDQTINMHYPDYVSKRQHVPFACPVCMNPDKQSYLDHYHMLIVPGKNIDFRSPNMRYRTESHHLPSSPYSFPWRTDVNFEWPEHVEGDIIMDPEAIEWR